MAKKAKSKNKKAAAKSLVLNYHHWFLVIISFVIGIFSGLLIAALSVSNATGYTKADSFIGLSEQDAINKAKDKGYSYRIVERDGESFPQTMDLRNDRVNFTIVQDEVVKAKFY